MALGGALEVFWGIVREFGVIAVMCGLEKNCVRLGRDGEGGFVVFGGIYVAGSG